MKKPAVINDFNDIKLDRHAIIEASAGTGKTHTIENLFLRLMAERGAEYDQILVLTFTEKATGELRERIRRNIKARASGENDPAKKERLKSAYENFDHAPIFTIHSFCNLVLRQYAFENGGLFRTSLEDDEALYGKMLREQMRKDWPRWFGEVLDAALAVSGFPGLENGASRWEETVISIARFYRPASGDRIIPEIIKDLRNVFGEHLEAVNKALDEIRRSAGAVDADDVTRSEFYAAYGQLGIREDWVEGRRKSTIAPLLKLLYASRPGAKPDIAAWCAFIEGVKADAFQKLTSGVKDTAAFPQLERLVRSLEGLRALFVDRQISRQLAHLAIVELKKSVEQHKRQKGVISYDDMLTAVDKALSEPKTKLLLEQLRKRYRYALIDEFQDTDAVQWAIFKQIFLGSPDHRLFVIGDPKQAIYSFRGADVYAYIEARREMAARTDTEIYSLATNWRSTPQLIDAFNGLFEKGEWFPEGEISYLPVRSPAASLKRLHVDEDRTGTKALTIVDFGEARSAKRAGRAMAVFVASEIKRLLGMGTPALVFGKSCEEERPLAPGDICVLVRTRPEAEIVERIFERDEFRIPYSFYKKGKLYQSPEAGHIAYLLNAIADPTDGNSFKKALLTPFLGVRPEELSSYEDLPPSHPLRQLFERWYEYAAKRSWPLLFQSILDRTGVRYDHIVLPAGERALTNYEHIFENLGQEASQHNLDFNGIVERLDLYRRELEAGEEEFNLHRLETEKDKVKILTIHAAKGLEYPVVFIGGGFTAYGGVEPYLKYHDEKHRIVYDLMNAAADVPNYKDEKRGEDRRIFYVALTRAMCKLYVPRFRLTASDKWAGPIYHIVSPALGKAFGGAVQHPAVGMIGADETGMAKGLARPAKKPSSAAGAKSPAKELPEPLFPDIRFSFKERTIEIDSFSGIHARMRSAAKPEEETPVAKADDDTGRAAAVDIAPRTQPAKEKMLPAGADTGSMLHEIFERIDFSKVGSAPSHQDLKTDADMAKLVDAKLSKYGFLGSRLYQRAGLDDAFYRDEVFRTVWSTLKTPLLPDGAFSLGDVSRTDMIHELGFHFPLPGSKDPRIPGLKYSREGFLTGFIDLVFRHDDRYYILDWKSNYLEDGYSPASVKRSMDESDYHLQYKLYTIAVLRWLKLHVEGFDYGKHFGGVHYIYLRGRNGKDADEGAFFCRPRDEKEVRSYEDMLCEMVNRL